MDGGRIDSRIRPIQPDTMYERILSTLCTKSQETLPRSGLEDKTTGSGIVVGSSGQVLTNAHVVQNCRAIRVFPGNWDTRIVALDRKNDLALLHAKEMTSETGTFRDGNAARVGEAVLVAGYPLRGVLASDINVTTGTLSALAGLGNDTSQLQITAPIQPGNSGGPLLDMSGNIIGVVVAKLNTIQFAKATGDIPQNVNFAITSNVAKDFLRANSIKYKSKQSNARLETADIADRARSFTKAIECLK
jgi:Trypsin-like serine proteases, typically periplasmic, contain C-terminal PDZ domain